MGMNGGAGSRTGCSVCVNEGRPAPLFPMWLHAMFKPCRPLQSQSAAATAS